MKLTKITPKIRRARKLGEAVEYELELNHMGLERPSRAGRPAVVHLGAAQVIELYDLADSASSVERETMAGQLWAQLMTTVERLHGEYADLDLPEEDSGDEIETYLAWGEARGFAQGLALALAVLANPRHPDMDAVRAESAERWEAAAES